MAGAHGTLGVLSEVSFKVLPKPEAEATVLVSGIDLPGALRVMSAALGSPYDVTGAAYNPEQAAAYVRVEGFAASVEYRCEKLIRELSPVGAAVRVDRTDELWCGVRDVTAFHNVPGDVWRISVKPSDAVQVAASLGAKALQFDWGAGLIWALVPEGENVRAQLAVQGHANLVRASNETKARLGQFQPQPAPLAALSAGLRAQFDPRGILNPGLMG